MPAAIFKGVTFHSTIRGEWAATDITDIRDVARVIPICRWPGRNFPSETKTILSLHTGGQPVFLTTGVVEVKAAIRQAGGQIAGPHREMHEPDEHFIHCRRGMPIRVLEPRVQDIRQG